MIPCIEKLKGTFDNNTKNSKKNVNKFSYINNFILCQWPGLVNKGMADQASVIYRRGSFEFKWDHKSKIKHQELP